jgi:hypothetical protein
MVFLVRQLFVAIFGGVVAAGVILFANGAEPKARIALAQTSAAVTAPNALDADARKAINYQGQVFNPNGGAPYVNTALNFSFRLYNNPSGTNQVYRDDRFIVTNADGFFSTNVGDNGNFGDVYDIFNGQELYLRVYINDQELTPLQPITFVPYAFWSVHANHLGDYDADDFPKIIAYGVVNANGTRRSGEGFNSTLTDVAGSDVYVIELDDARNHSIDDYTTIVTPACASPVITGIGSSEGDLVIDVWNQDGARVTCTFQFMTLEK